MKSLDISRDELNKLENKYSGIDHDKLARRYGKKLVELDEEYKDNQDKIHTILKEVRVIESELISRELLTDRIVVAEFNIIEEE